MTDLSGQTIRGYEFIRQIGAGGYGVVYEARELSVERTVAVKLILPAHASDPQFMRDFEAEARLVAQLEHKDIVPLYAYWQDDKGAFLVMRYIRGGTLRQLLQQQGALPLERTNRLIQQITAALHTAHEAAVVHRDLKPENILIDERGSAYLTDFGIAKRVGPDAVKSASDAIKGTFAYLSPEQIRQEGVSIQTDVYALGVMLYEMLTGQHPFAGEPPTMMVMKHLNEPLPSLFDHRSDLPPAADDIIEQATAKAPTDRYPTTLAVADALASVASMPFTGQQTAHHTAPATPRRHREALSPDERNRLEMIENVRRFWVQGILDQSLYRAVQIELDMVAQHSAVTNPWHTLLKVPDAPLQKLPDGTRILDVYERLQGKLLVLGDPGSGKTTTLLALARDLLNQAEAHPQAPIPVVFNLSSWADKRLPLADWLRNELHLRYLVSKKQAREWVEGDRLLLLLDGLDEVAAAHRNDCVHAINAYRQEHGLVDVVVCSRIADYQALTARLHLNGAIVLQPLDQMQVGSYLHRAGEGMVAVRQVLDEDDKLREITRSPLMLNILMLAYQGMARADIEGYNTLAARRNHIFATYVDRVLERRGVDHPYSPERTKQYLGWLAERMSHHEQSVFFIDNLGGMWLRTRLERFWYVVCVMLPFYPVAALVSGIVLFLVWGILLVGLGLLISSRPEFGAALESVFSERVIAWIFFGIPLMLWPILTFLVPVLLMYLDRRSTYKITPIYNLRWRWPQKEINELWWIYGRVFLVGEVFTLIFVAVTSVRLTLLAGRPMIFAHSAVGYAMLIAFLFPALLAIASAPLMSIMKGFYIAPLESRKSPNQGIQRSALFTVMAIVPIIVFILGAERVIPLVSDESMVFLLRSLVVFISATILFRVGFYVLYQHFILRVILWLGGNAPWNLSRFLDYASERILLRRVSGGYIFIHRMLLDYFAAPDGDGAVEADPTDEAAPIDPDRDALQARLNRLLDSHDTSDSATIRLHDGQGKQADD